MKGFYGRQRPFDLFMVFLVLSLFSVSLYTAVFVLFSGSEKPIVAVGDARLQRRWQELTHLQGLVTDLHNELAEAVAERDELDIRLKQILETEDGKRTARETNVINPLRNRLPSRLRSRPLLNCPHIDAIRIVSQVAAGSSKIVQRGLYGAKEVLVKRVNADGETFRRCRGKMSAGECVMLGRYGLLREICLLMDLQNVNVVEIIGWCVRGSGSSSDVADQSLLLVTEYGDPVVMQQLQEKPLKQKIEMSANILELLSFLAASPLGSVRIEPFDLTQFRLMDGRLKLTHVDSLTTEEPLCETHSDCIVQTEIGYQPACIHDVCKGYNSLLNLRDAHKNILTPLLLQSNGLSEKSTKEIANILNSLQSDGNMSLFTTAENLRQLSFQDNRQEANEEDAAADQMSPFNDLNIDSHQRNAAAEVAKHQVAAGGVQSKHNGGSQVSGYREIANVDFPGMYDYPCRRTRAKWGCVLAVYGLDDAKRKCTNDPECRSFVMVPHHSRNGWSTAFFKNGATGHVSHEGTNVYVKQYPGSVRTTTNPTGIQQSQVPNQSDDVFASKPSYKLSSSQESRSFNDSHSVIQIGTSCPLEAIYASQLSLRQERERHLMEDMGWAGMTDKIWLNLLRSGTVTAEDFGKATTDSNGGGILVTLNKENIRKAWFKVEPGTGYKRRHIAHIALFYLDRLLGMFQTVPTTGRILSLQEMQNGHFSSAMKEVKRRFAAQLTSDGKLHGSMSAWINQDVGIKRKLSISPNADLAWAVSPLTEQQRNDLEYLIVMWLGRLNQTPDQFLCRHGRMVHLDGHMALQQPAVDVFPYFNICQFPRHLVEMLRYMQKHADNGCKLSEQLAQVLRADPLGLMPEHFSRQSTDSSLHKVDEEAAKFLELVQKCIERFGETITLYT